MERTMENATKDRREDGTRSSRRTTGWGFCHPKWCGVMMLIAGALWLAAILNWINGDLFWPLLLIIMGSWIVLSFLWKRGNENGKQVSYPGGGR